ncbi:GH25 family lysozyme [Lelliottia sp. V106_10]|uniref:GH25 family lysozyme n=1 Tax=Lelliottia TaxID=1330545 RepID=UPI00254E8F9B|nr:MULTISPECIES: GH25 family lysozyme [unclassified Lelliottia]MDK9358953.1 GH25 family lysozyme [Lelliottia sp. V106_16]MDK9373641.1 GH25 family lysozyme [Lelliottia sp. V106_10]MDK9600319.1 GH25 family lysozyme [Lelliottia sp. V106_5]
MSSYPEIPLKGSVTTTVLVNVRQGKPSILAPVVQKMAAGQTVSVLAVVVGDNVEGNTHWYRISTNTFIWAGACTAVSQHSLAAPALETNAALQHIPFVVDLYHGDEVNSFQQAKNAGLVAVIHKATTGASGRDDEYDNRRIAAKNAGLMWGAYHWGTAADISQQVKNFLDYAQPDENTLIALDFEPTPGNQMTEEGVRAFCQAIYSKLNRRPVIYGSNLLREKLGNTRDPFYHNHRLWLAQYNAHPTLPVHWDQYWLWQYTDGPKGPSGCRSVPGIPGNYLGHLDCNYFPGTAQELKEQWAT